MEKTRIEKHYEACQEKGMFKAVEFKDLDEAQSQELYANYLGKIEGDIEAISAKSEEEKKGLEAEIKTLKAEKSASEAEYAKLTNEMTKQLLDDAAKASPESAPDIKKLKELCEDVHKNQVAKKDFSVKLKSELVTKAVTLTTSVVNSTLAQRADRVGELAHRVLSAYDAIPLKIRLNEHEGGTYRYVDIDPATSVRAAATIAETDTIPESTIGFVERSIALKDIGDHLPYSMNFAYDFARFMQYLLRFLRQNVGLELDDQIINGDGLGDNLNGIISSIPVYIPVAEGITDANLADLIEVEARDIKAQLGSKYNPNVVMLNSNDIVSINLGLKKDANNNYQPLEERLARKGFVLIENNSLTENTMILGDADFSAIIEDGDINIETNVTANDDALKRIRRILVYMRKNVLIRVEEAEGWFYTADIDAALTVISS